MEIWAGINVPSGIDPLIGFHPVVLLNPRSTACTTACIQKRKYVYWCIRVFTCIHKMILCIHNMIYRCWLRMITFWSGDKCEVAMHDTFQTSNRVVLSCMQKQHNTTTVVRFTNKWLLWTRSLIERDYLLFILFISYYHKKTWIICLKYIPEQSIHLNKTIHI